MVHIEQKYLKTKTTTTHVHTTLRQKLWFVRKNCIQKPKQEEQQHTYTQHRQYISKRDRVTVQCHFTRPPVYLKTKTRTTTTEIHRTLTIHFKPNKTFQKKTEKVTNGKNYGSYRTKYLKT